MVTDSLISKHFIHEILAEGIKQIYSVQEEVIRSESLVKTGKLQKVISAHNMDFLGAEGRETVYVRYLLSN